MLRSKNLILALLCQFLSVDAGFSYDWSNWIILPADSKTNVAIGADIDSLRRLHINQSEVPMQNYLDHEQTDSYIMSLHDASNDYHPREIQNDGEKLVLPLGRAVAAVKNICALMSDFFNEDDDMVNEGLASATGTSRKIKKVKKKKKKYKKFLLPLLIAYKLKFVTLVPLLIGGLILLVGTTGLAGFFFALFAAVMSLKSESKFELKQW